MLTVNIEPTQGLAAINVWIDENASEGDLQDAWNSTSNGILLSHLREALRFECIRRGIDASEILAEPPN